MKVNSVKWEAKAVPLRLLNTPLMVSRAEFDLIIDALQPEPRAFSISDLFDQEHAFEMIGDIAVIPITGGLTYRGFGWYWRTTYQQIRKYFMEAMQSADVKAVLLDIHSPGGEVAGVFDLADTIYQMRGQKPVYTVANESALSAAYLLASATDKIYLSRTAMVGSIGVRAVHYEQSRLEKDVGVKYTAVYFGERKDDYSPHKPLDAKVRAALQESVDKTGRLFAETVARNRKLTVEAVIDTQAAIYEGAEAVDMGLADEVLAWDAVIETITASLTQKTGGSYMQLPEIKTSLSTFLADGTLRAQAVAMLGNLGFVPKPAQEPPDVEKLTADATKAGREEGMQAATETALAIIAQCNAAEMSQMAEPLIKEGVSSEEAGRRISEAQAEAEAAKNISSTVGALSSGEMNPLVADAQRRAEGK